jgi:putative ABC transport system permease protein
MFQNDIKIALRNLRANKFFTLLNVLGLALGMSGCLTVILIIRDQLSYDHFHPSGERTFRLLSQQFGANGEAQGKAATTPFPLGEKLVSDFAAVEKTTRLVRGIDGNDAKTASGLTLPITGYFTEPTFFEIFGFALEVGNATTALREPNSIVLTRKTAERFFGSENPLGQTLDINGWGIFRVTGIAARVPGKSHIGFECLASSSSLPAVEQGYKPEEAGFRVTDNWQNRWSTLTYVHLQAGKNRQDLEAALAVTSENISEKNENGEKTALYAQNLSKITPAPELLTNEIGFGFPWFIIWALGAFVALLIVFPCLNYANLAVARALERAKEVGIRKVVGARERELTRLFLTESVLTALMALVAAWFMHHGLNHFLEQKLLAEMNLRGSEPISFDTDGTTLLYFLLFSVAAGLFSGWLPARRLSKMRPAAALRSTAGDAVGRKRRFGLRTAMTVGQFALSLVFMIVVGTLWNQLHYMTLADYGFQKENLLTVPLRGNKLEPLATEIAQDHRVTGVCAASILIAGNSLQSTEVYRQPAAEAASISYVHCDKNYVPVMNLQLVAGQNFPENANPERENVILLNEKAVEHFQLGTPAEAVGKTLWLNDSTPVLVSGVLANFHFRPLKDAVTPFALRFSPKNCEVLQIRLAPGDPRQSLAAIESIWKKVDPVHPFEGTFMEEKISKAYSDIELLSGLIGFFAILGLSLACLGLLGMVTHSVGVQVKEVGVRKVLGASVGQVVLLLSRRFLLLLAIATAMAVPMGWFLSNFILDFFAYRISVGVGILGGSAAILLLFGLLAVGVQTVRAALANPVKSLRSE